MASPKAWIVTALGRDELRQAVDRLGAEGVDRRSLSAMRSALQRSRRIGLEDLLQYLRKDYLAMVCWELGVPVSGMRDGADCPAVGGRGISADIPPKSLLEGENRGHELTIRVRGDPDVGCVHCGASQVLISDVSHGDRKRDHRRLLKLSRGVDCDLPYKS